MRRASPLGSPPTAAPILLTDQDRSRWDRTQIARGRAALRRVDEAGRGRGSYALQAAIAECHAIAPSVDETDWERIVVLDEVLGRIAPSPVIELNRAVAVSMATGPANALRIVDRLASEAALRDRTCCRACAASCSPGSVASRRRGLS